MSPIRAFALTLAAAAAAPHAVRADDAAADAKFQSGLHHFKAQEYDTACAEFEESEHLGPNPSTEYYLAKCAIVKGHPARAWNLFKQAAAVMPDARQRAAAEQAATDLNNQIGLVTLVGTQPAPSLEVRLDDDNVTSQVLVGQAVAVEPGPHVLRATAPDRNEWKREFTIAKGESLSFTVPTLPSTADGGVITTPSHGNPTGEPTPPTPTVPTSDHSSVTNGPTGGSVVVSSGSRRQWTSGRRHLAYAAIGTGAVGLGVGTVFGVLAMSKWNDAKSGCTDNGGVLTGCPVGADAARKDAQSKATISTVGFVLGGAGVAGAVFLYLTTPKETARPQHALRVVPVAPNGDVGMSVVGRF